VEYRNDSALDTSALRYIDIVTVTDSSGSWKAYQCVKTHTSSSTITTANTTYWQVMNTMQPIYTPLLLATYAKIRFGQLNQLLVQDDSGKIIAGMGGGNYTMWSGAATAAEANFKVSSSGVMSAVDAILKGYVEATGGKFGSLRIEGTDIVGVDTNGNSVVRLSMGSVPSTSSAYVSQSINFGLTSDEQEVYTNVAKDNYGTYRGTAEAPVYYEKLQDTTTNSYISYVVNATFTLSQAATSVSIGDISGALTTTYGGLAASPQMSLLATLYKKSGTSWTAVKSVSDNSGNRISIDVNSLAAGDYKVEITTSVNADDVYNYMSGTSWQGLLDLDIQSIIVKTASTATDTAQLVIASDGLLSMKDSTHFMRWSGSDGFEVRFGNYGLKVSSTGLQKYSNNSWSTL
jgi:hypothetical protein